MRAHDSDIELIEGLWYAANALKDDDKLITVIDTGVEDAPLAHYYRPVCPLFCPSAVAYLSVCYGEVFEHQCEGGGDQVQSIH